MEDAADPLLDSRRLAVPPGAHVLRLTIDTPPPAGQWLEAAIRDAEDRRLADAVMTDGVTLDLPFTLASEGGIAITARASDGMRSRLSDVAILPADKGGPPTA